MCKLLHFTIEASSPQTSDSEVETVLPHLSDMPQDSYLMTESDVSAPYISYNDYGNHPRV